VLATSADHEYKAADDERPSNAHRKVPWLRAGHAESDRVRLKLLLLGVWNRYHKGQQSQSHADNAYDENFLHLISLPKRFLIKMRFSIAAGLHQIRAASEDAHL